MYMKNLIYTSLADSEEDWWGSSNHQAATWHILMHMVISAALAQIK